MKKFISLLLCMMLVLCSCGAKTEVSSTDLEKPHGPKVDSYGLYDFYIPENTEYDYIAEFDDFVASGIAPCFYILHGLSAADDFTITDVATTYSIKDADTEEKENIEDKEYVVKSFKALIDAGVYKEDLYSDL